MRTAYIIEHLTPSGVHRSNVLHYRRRDAMSHAARLLTDPMTRMVNIVPVAIGDAPVFSKERKPLKGANHAGR